jgi:exonuclease III
MSVSVCSRGIVLALLDALILTAVPAAVRAQSAPASFKVAYYNIQSGKGEPAMPGHATEFYDVTNCTDGSQPMNAWGIGLLQRHLVESVGKDSRIIALGLGESWASVCGSPENVRNALGWKSRSSERNGVGMVARYGFAGPEEWIQLDTSLNTNPADTMWVLRVPVCMNVECTQSINVFSAHWYATGTSRTTSYDRQAQQTVAFIQRAGGGTPHVLVGDLNVWEGVAACGQNPNPSGLSRLRDAGYIDAWPYVNGSLEGFTGMTNRPGCGTPEGYGWKRIDYAWSPADFRPLSMTRFGIVPGGDGAPSDHYGVIAEYPWPGGPVLLDTIPPVVALANPGDGQTVSGTMAISATAADDLGVTRVEIIEDGVVAHTSTSAPYRVDCDTTMKSDGVHTIAARAFDAAGNVGSSPTVTTYIQNKMGDPAGTPSTTDVVLYAKHANVRAGGWAVVTDATAAGGARMASTDAGAAKLTAALAAPANYFEMTFSAEAGRAYRLWIRGRAARDYWGNDSVFVQFSGSVDAAKVPVFRIGTTGAATVNLEDCSGCGIAGWGWQDNGYGTGVLGPLVYFAASGPQTIRVQPREDGLSIDQIVLSSQRYLTAAPGTLKLDATIVPIEYVAPLIASRKEIVIGASSPTTLAGGWKLLADSSAANGTAVGHPDAGGAKLAAALASPVHFVEFTFDADAGRSYRLWLRGRADRDYWGNDSVFVQFSDAVDASGNPVYRIGSADSTSVNLEDGSGAGIAGWGWQDNGYGTGVLGPVIRFATTGRQTIRIQTREDGLRIDQIVLSAERYLTTAPGALKNDSTVVR